MKVINLCEHRIVIRRVLAILVVPYEDHLDFFHVILLKHLIGAFLYNIVNRRLVSATVVPSLMDLIEDFSGELMTFLEASMVCTNKN